MCNKKDNHHPVVNNSAINNSNIVDQQKCDKFSLINTTISLVRSQSNDGNSAKQSHGQTVLSKRNVSNAHTNSKVKSNLTAISIHPSESSCITVNDISICSVNDNKLRKDKSKQNSKRESVNVILESKSEELSVEIDPMDYDLTEETFYPKDIHKDYQNIQSQLTSNQSLDLADPLLQTLLDKKIKNLQDDNLQIHSGHFLTSSNSQNNSFVCEICFKSFISYEMLWGHKMLHHNGIDELIKPDHDTLSENTITLKDLIENRQNSSINQVSIENVEMIETEFRCSECSRYFSSARRLSRHYETYHSTKTPKKYFTKGTKNAKCDICNKEVSTQAYLQIHKKLHYRKGEYEAYY